MSLVDAAEIAETLGVTPRCIYKWAAAKKLPGAYRLNGVWRFDAAIVGAWVRQNEAVKWQASTSAASDGTADIRSAVRKYDASYERLLGRRPSGK